MYNVNVVKYRTQRGCCSTSTEVSMRDYSTLPFTDDFMFCKIMQNNEDLCKELVELILDVKIRSIICPDKQKSIEITADGRGIRLDVYLEDNDEAVYDIEMQMSDPGNLPQRSRYYQGMIDLSLIERGSDYEQLKKSYIIFISTFDLFGKDLCRYTFKYYCKEDKKLELGDGTTKVFLNAKGTDTSISEGLREVMEYIATGRPKGSFTNRLEAKLNAARSNEKWRLDYMTLDMKYKEKFKEGLNQGHEEVALKMISMGLPKKTVSEATGIKLAELDRLSDTLK